MLLPPLQRDGILYRALCLMWCHHVPWIELMPIRKPGTELKNFFKAHLSSWRLLLTLGSAEVVCLAQGPNNTELAFPADGAKFLLLTFSPWNLNVQIVSLHICNNDLEADMLLMSLNNCEATQCYCSGMQQWYRVTRGFVSLVSHWGCSSASRTWLMTPMHSVDSKRQF